MKNIPLRCTVLKRGEKKNSKDRDDKTCLFSVVRKSSLYIPLVCFFVLSRIFLYCVLFYLSVVCVHLLFVLVWRENPVLYNEGTISVPSSCLAVWGDRHQAGWTMWLFWEGGGVKWDGGFGHKRFTHLGNVDAVIGVEQVIGALGLG